LNLLSDRINALCFDIDDLIYGLNLRNSTDLPYRYLVEEETYSLLEFLAGAGVVSTMFIPGYVAELFPTLVKEVFRQGHEVGSHGYTHMVTERLGKAGFREDISRSKKVLEDILSVEISVYKAPEWSITARTPWAYDELIGAGYRLDNTAQPSLLKSLGRGPGEMTPFKYRDSLTVVPVTSCRLFRRDVPFNGGLFCAYVPVRVQMAYYEGLNRRGISFNYYCHPFEICPYGANKHPWKYGSIHTAFYGMYFGWYKRYVERLTKHFRLAPLSVAYEQYLCRNGDVSAPGKK
jgi:polysaccharide deacetylase family protein (PEP-CTERM system associated)